MTAKEIEALAKLYGIDINRTQDGEGGLYFVDSQNHKSSLNYIFDSADYSASRQETVSLSECGTYNTYSTPSSAAA